MCALPSSVSLTSDKSGVDKSCTMGGVQKESSISLTSDKRGVDKSCTKESLLEEVRGDVRGQKGLAKTLRADSLFSSSTLRNSLLPENINGLALGFNLVI